MKKPFLILYVILFFAMAGFVIFNIRQSSPVISNPDSTEPERIVSLSPNITEILYALGLNDKIVAVSSDSDYPAEAAQKIKVGNFWQPSTESVIAARPDLVITLSFEQQKNTAETLERLGYRTLSVQTDKIDQLWTAIQQIGTSAACSKQADGLIENLKNQFEKIHSQYNSYEKVRVLWVIQAEPLRLAGRDTFINELIELAGGQNAIGQTIQQYPEISTEQLLASDAEVIIQSAMDSDNIEKQQRAAEIFWSKYPNLPAVQNKRIYVIDSDTILRLGPRIPLGLEMIAHYLHEFKE